MNGGVKNAKTSFVEIVEGQTNESKIFLIDHKRFTKCLCSSVSQLYMDLENTFPLNFFIVIYSFGKDLLRKYSGYNAKIGKDIYH